MPGIHPTKTGEDSQDGDRNLPGVVQAGTYCAGGNPESAGYAVFNNTGTNLLLLSTPRGAGIAADTQTKKGTFMKMISAGARLAPYLVAVAASFCLAGLRRKDGISL